MLLQLFLIVLVMIIVIKPERFPEIVVFCRDIIERLRKVNSLPSSHSSKD